MSACPRSLTLSIPYRSAVKKGYVNDPFLSYFVRKPQNRAPLINRGYYSRVAAVDVIYQRFVAIASRTGTGRSQVVSLGAGFDTTFFRSRMEGSAASLYFEVDFPEVTARKAAIFRKHALLQRVIAGQRVTVAEALPLEQSSSATAATPAPSAPAADIGVSYSTTSSGGCTVSSPVYRMVTADLRDVAAVRAALLGAGFDPSTPTLFLSECVLVYLEPEESCALIAWAASACPRSVFVTYEQIRPHDAFGQVMTRNLEERGYSLRGLTAFPDIASQTARYRELGFGAATVADMNDVYYRVLPRADVARVERLELFDEVEEWHLMSAHYCIAVAVNELPLAQLQQRGASAVPAEHPPLYGHHHHATAAAAEDTHTPPAPESPARSIVTDVLSSQSQQQQQQSTEMPAPPPKTLRGGAAPQHPRPHTDGAAAATSSSSSQEAGGSPGAAAFHSSLSPRELAAQVVASHESEVKSSAEHHHHHYLAQQQIQRSTSARSAGSAYGGSQAQSHPMTLDARLVSASQASSASSASAGDSSGPLSPISASSRGHHHTRNRSHSRSRSVAGSETEMEIAIAVESASGTVVEGMDITPSPSPRVALPSSLPSASSSFAGGKAMRTDSMSGMSPPPHFNGGGMPSVIYTHGGDVHIRSHASHPLDFGAIAEAEEELTAARQLRGAMMPRGAGSDPILTPLDGPARSGTASSSVSLLLAGAGTSGGGERAGPPHSASAATAGAAALHPHRDASRQHPEGGSAAATSGPTSGSSAGGGTHYDGPSILRAHRPVSLADMLLPIEQWVEHRHQLSPKVARVHTF